MYQILIVEDDRGLSEGIMLALKDETNHFTAVGCMKDARRHWKERKADMILLDINLPDGSGYDLLREIRLTSHVPVLMITANDMESDEVAGLMLGADDYITKPFSLMVLRARVERLRKRAVDVSTYKGYQDMQYQFDFAEMKFSADGKEVFLSRTEQKLLRLFVQHEGQTLSRDQLSESIWPDGLQYVDENALSVTVNRLRRKLDGKQKCPIQTVYGLGYVWEKKQ